jgi:hypothetical protein
MWYYVKYEMQLKKMILHKRWNVIYEM